MDWRKLAVFLVVSLVLIFYWQALIDGVFALFRIVVVDAFLVWFFLAVGVLFAARGRPVPR